MNSNFNDDSNNTYAEAENVPQGGYSQPYVTPQGGYQQPYVTPQVGYQQPYVTPQGGYQQPYGASQGGYQQPYVAPAGGKKKIALISVISVLIAGIITFGVLIMTGVVSIGKPKLSGLYKPYEVIDSGRSYIIDEYMDTSRVDGNYELYKVIMDAKEYSRQDLANQYGPRFSKKFITRIMIDGDKCEIEMYGQSEVGSVKVSGNTVSITEEGETGDFLFDDKEGTLTLQLDDKTVILKKTFLVMGLPVDSISFQIDEESFTFKAGDQSVSGSIEYEQDSDKITLIPEDDSLNRETVEYDSKKQTITVEDDDTVIVLKRD